MIDGYFRRLSELGKSNLFWPDSFFHACFLIPIVFLAFWHIAFVLWLCIFGEAVKNEWINNGVACFFPYNVKEFGFCVKSPFPKAGKPIIILNEDGTEYNPVMICQGDLCPL